MKIYTEKNLRNFEFLGGAIDFVTKLTFEQLDQVEAILEEEYPDGMDETTVNDIFWFEQDTIREWLDMPTEDQEDAKTEIDKYNSDFVAWVCDAQNLDIDSPEDWEEILDQLEDPDMQDEYKEDSLEGKIYD